MGLLLPVLVLIVDVVVVIKSTRKIEINAVVDSIDYFFGCEAGCTEKVQRRKLPNNREVSLWSCARSVEFTVLKRQAIVHEVSPLHPCIALIGAGQ